MKKTLLLTTIFLSLSASVWAKPIDVTTSFSILGDVAHEIGGDRVVVHSIIGPNEDAHGYKLKPQDVNTIQKSNLVLLNGLGLESATFNRAVKESKVPFAIATDHIKPRTAEEDGLNEDEHEAGEAHNDHQFDPHVWNDPVLMKTYADNVAKALIKVDPEGKAYYTKRLNHYESELDGLNKWTQQQFAGIPDDKRRVLTAHDAFGYFGARYKIEFIAPQGVSEDDEPSAKNVADIIRQVNKEHIRAVFIENIKNPKLVKQLADETKLHISGELYSDALSEPNGEAPTYLKMIRHNVSLLSKAMKQ